MSEDRERLQKLVEEAAGVVSASQGKIKVVDSMKYVGFSTPERKNITNYQRVRRLIPKVTVVPLDKTKAPPMEVSVLPGEDEVSSLTTETRNKNPSSRAARAARRKVLRPSPHTPSTNSISSSSSSARKSSEKTPAAKGKRTRRSSKEVQRSNAKECREKQLAKEALKLATRLIKQSQSLPPKAVGKKSISVIVKEVNEELGSNVSESTAGRYVRLNMAGQSPMKKGPVGDFPPRIYNALKGAYTTYLKLEQAESKRQSGVKKMAKRVNAVVNKAGFHRNREDLTRKLKKDTADNFEAQKANTVEQRRLMWTTSYNLNVWFTTWKEMLIELGFARDIQPEDEGFGSEEVHFFAGMKDRIINLDETDGSLDDTSHQRGGRPAMTFYAPEVAGGGTAVNKSGYSCTIICGSNAAGDPIPAHFQLKTVATKEENQRINVDWIINSKNVIAKFGFPERRAFPCTFGMNEKAGMNSVELHKYLKGSILPLYPDLEDVPGKRILLKCDSGPGRMNVEMLAELQLQGAYLVPGVPNTTSKTQETDQNYGPFKTATRTNLRTLSQARFDKGCTLQVSDLPLIVFGGTCSKTGVNLKDAFSSAFGIQRNIECWEKCGAVPLTRSPLKTASLEIRTEIPEGAAALQEDVVEDEQVATLKQLEIANRLYCDILDSNAMDGSHLRKEAPRRKTYVAVTQPHSKERIKAIKESKTAGQMFYSTGGRHLNSDEFFKARELARREAKSKELEKRKMERAKLILEQRDAVKILRSKGELNQDTEKKFTLAECKCLLRYRKGGPKPATTKKADIVDAYTNAPKMKPTKVWSRSEEAELKKCKEEEIELNETALSVSAGQMARAIGHNLATLDSESRAVLKAAIDNFEDIKEEPNVI